MTEEEYRDQLRDFYGKNHCFICNPTKYSNNRELCESCKRVYKILEGK